MIKTYDVLSTTKLYTKLATTNQNPNVRVCSESIHNFRRQKNVNYQDVFILYFKELDVNINAETSAHTLKRLRVSIKNKHAGMLTNGATLLRNNARLHLEDPTTYSIHLTVPNCHCAH